MQLQNQFDVMFSTFFLFEMSGAQGEALREAILVHSTILLPFWALLQPLSTKIGANTSKISNSLSSLSKTAGTQILSAGLDIYPKLNTERTLSAQMM